METDINQGLRPILDYFYKIEQDDPNRPFLKQPFGTKWQTLSYGEVGIQARKLVSYLRSIGLQTGDHVAMLSKNCTQWIITDLALMMGNFVSVPFYPNLTATQLSEILERSEAKALFVGKLEDWENQQEAIQTDFPVIRFPHYDGNSNISNGISWDEVMSQNEPINGYPLPDLEDLWTILFTSGTTGTPKGVMLKHKCPSLIVRSEEIHDHLKFFNGLPNRFFSYLPLNHIAERIIVEVASIVTGGTISFAESIESFPKNLQDTQPTLFIAVPRIWTKFQMAIRQRIPQSFINLILATPILSSVFKNKIKHGLGLSKARIILTGAAPAPVSLKHWYAKLGIRLREVYGMTESCGGCTIMPENEQVEGSVGKPVPNAEVEIAAENNEVLMRMPWMMHGYYKDEERTAQVLKNGWIHTGDRGRKDKNGHIYITGRIKDAFKSSKGKFVIPAPLEWALSKNQYIEQICIVGMNLPQPIGLIILSEIGQTATSNSLEQSLLSSLNELNKHVSKHEKVASLVILRDEWSIENDLLTPTMKLKRNRVNDQYQNQYIDWFSQGQPIIWAEEALLTK